MQCTVIGAPVEDGAGRRGCDMGPSALRTAGLLEMLADLGHSVDDRGNVAPVALTDVRHANPALKALPQVAAWTEALARVAADVPDAAMPIFLGGDHSVSAGTLAGLALRAEHIQRPLYVLWLDAHADFHTLDTTASGNLHGVPMAYVTGQAGFAGAFPTLEAVVDPTRVAMLGLRSVDQAERRALERAGVVAHDMRAIDERGIAALLQPFLDTVTAAGGLLHVSLDVDFLDPAIAPAVGTTVPGGATFREAHLIMEMLCDSGLVKSLDLVELNPFLDERGRTATLMVDLTASLLGRRILDRPTRSF